MSSKPKIICVDDETHNLEALHRLLRKDFDVQTASSGKQALQILKDPNQKFAVLLTDQRMPEMTGVELLEAAEHFQKDAVKIMLTGYSDMDAIIDAVNKGHIYRYIAKPWDAVDLVQTVKSAAELHNTKGLLQKKNRELEDAYKELKTLDEAKSRFMILINHELKTPLTSILNFTTLLENSQLDDEQKMSVGHISKNGIRLRSLIDDTLMIMRAQTNQIKIEVLPVLINDLTKLLDATLLVEMEKRGLSLSQEITEVTLNTDPRLLREIIGRIFHNALKFSAKGSTLHFSLSSENSELVATLTNPGQSFDPSPYLTKTSIFVTSENIMNHSQGQGLGLAIAKMLADLLGGKMHIACEEGLVTVSVRIPSLASGENTTFTSRRK